MKYLLCISILLAAFTLNAEPVAPDGLVKSTSDKVLAVLDKNRKRYERNPQVVYDIVNRMITSHFDFPSMSRWVLGKYWRRASKEQRKAFTVQFKEMLVRTYSVALMEYTGRPVNYLPFYAAEESKKVIVRTVVELRGGHYVPIHYRLHYKDDGWKVYDVLVDGVSLVTNYRQAFTNEISLNGLDYLIDKLEERNHELLDERNR